MRILIAGASGVVGRAALEHFSAEEGVEVLGLSRRPPETDVRYRHLALDLRDRAACDALGAELEGVTHLLYTALYEAGPGGTAQNADMTRINLEMLRNLCEPLLKLSCLEHVTLLQGTKAYGAHLGAMRIPGRERDPRVPHENFYFAQEDYLRERRADHGFGLTIWRPQVVLGHAVGAPMNVLATIGVYAALCRLEGRPCGFPGGPATAQEAVDADLLARAMQWGMETPACDGEVFNLTNGDVFSWREVWPSVVEVMGGTLGDPQPTPLTEWIPGREAGWDSVVREHGLRPHGLMELLGASVDFASALLGVGGARPRRPALVSTIKVRGFGFHECVDTEDSIVAWLRRLQQLRILPPA